MHFIENEPELEFNTPWERLAAAIILQAVKDYRDGSDRERATLERFFYSDWYATLSKVSPDYILKGLRQEKASLKRRRKIRAQRNISVKSKTDSIRELYKGHGFDI